MSKTSKSRVRDPRLKNASQKPINSPGASSKSLLAKIKTLNVWREQFNPLVGLDMPKARSLLQLGQRCEYADLQWTFKFVEERFPTLFALIERRTSPLLEKEYAIRTTPEEKLPPGTTKEMADAQAQHLAACYQRIENLKEAIEHLAMATFRGFAHLQKHRNEDVDGRPVDKLEVLDQWNFVRKGQRGNWFWNPDALQTAWQGLPPQNEIQGSGTVQYGEDGNPTTLMRKEFVIREVKRPVDPIALIAFIGWSMGKKDHRGFVEIYGIPGGVVIGPPNVSPDKEVEYQTAGQEIADGGSGYIPNGGDWKPNDGPRGVNPFKEFLRSEVEDVVLAGTGGLLTMLTESGSGTLAGEAHSQTFDKIARSEAAKISEVFQRDFDKQEIEDNFPGQPVLAFFELVSQDEDAEETLKFKRDVVAKFLSDGTVSDVIANQTDIKQLVRDVDLPVNDEYIDPYLPVQTQQGKLINGQLVKDAQGDVIGSNVDEGSGPTPGAPKPGDALPTTNDRLAITNRRIRNRGSASVALQSVFEELLVNAEEAYGSAQAKVFAPLRERLAECLKIANRDEQVLALRNLQRELPGMLKAMNARPETATVLERAMNSALAIGVEQTAEQQT